MKINDVLFNNPDLNDVTGGMNAEEIGGALLSSRQNIIVVSELMGDDLIASASIIDSGSFRQFGAAFKTVSAALGEARTGETILVKSGSYNYESIPLKEGVSIKCEAGVFFNDPIITAINIPELSFKGEACIKITDSSSTAFSLLNCTDFNIEISHIEAWKASGANSRVGIYAKNCSGEIHVKNEMFTYDKQLIAIDGQWSGNDRVVSLSIAGAYSYRTTENANNNDVQLIGVLNGAKVKFSSIADIFSDNNNLICIGQTTLPASELETKLTITGDCVFDSPVGTFLVRGDSTNNFAINVVEINGNTRHRGTEFSRSGGTSPTENIAMFFGNSYSQSGTTVFSTVPVGSLTITTEA